MKLTNLLLAFILILGVSSCKKDDSCTQDDWVGTYEFISRTGECDGLEKDDIVIAKSGDLLTINGETSTVSECTMVQSVEAFGVKVEIKMTLDGNNLNVVFTSTDEEGNTGMCTSSFKRK